MWMHPHTIKLMETNTNTHEAKQPPSAGCHPTTCSAVSILRNIVEQFDGPGLAHDQKDALADAHEWLHGHATECSHQYASAGLNTGRCIKCDAVKVFLPNSQADPSLRDRV